MKIELHFEPVPRIDYFTKILNMFYQTQRDRLNLKKNYIFMINQIKSSKLLENEALGEQTKWLNNKSKTNTIPDRKNAKQINLEVFVKFVLFLWVASGF